MFGPVADGPEFTQVADNTAVMWYNSHTCGRLECGYLTTLRVEKVLARFQKPYKTLNNMYLYVIEVEPRIGIGLAVPSVVASSWEYVCS